MHDTDKSRNAQQIGTINDMLTANWTHEFLTDKERRRLVALHAHLNAEIAPGKKPEKVARSVALQSWWNYFVANHLDRSSGIIFYVGLSMVAAVTAVTLVGMLMMRIGTSL